MMKRYLFRSGAVSAAGLLACQAGAQVTTPAAVPGDIVVTALHRRSTIQEAPLSIVALNGDTLNKLGATQLQDYFRQIPNLNVSQAAGGSSRLSIRGVSSVGEATVGLYYDETPITGPTGTAQDPGSVAADLNLFDVERVEALRGPQGTLYGSSSMAGTLRVIFNKPVFDRVEGAGETQVSSADGGGMGWFVKGMVNTPIIEDKLAVRLVGYYEKRPGYVDNIFFHKNDVNDSDSKGMRGLIGFKPDPDTNITATLIYQKSDTDDQEGWYPQLGRYKTNSQVQLPFDSKLQLYNLTGVHDFGGVTLTATGSYYRNDILRAYDFTPTTDLLSQIPALCQVYVQQATACSGSQLAAYRAYGLASMPTLGYQPAWLKSQNYEVRLASNRGRLIQWTIGAYYENRHDHIDSNTTVANPDGSAPDPLHDLSYRYVDTSTRQIAGFGEVSIHPTSRLTVTGGLRYFDYHKTTSGQVLLGNLLTSTFAGPYSEARANAHGWLEKLNVSYKLTNDAMVYATASKGFRPGGANNVPSLPSGLVAYQPDSLWNYEIGAKTSWLDNHLVIDAAIFQIDWNNIQVFARTPDGLFSFLTNAGAARIRGGEVNITLRPLRGLTLSGAAGYANARLTKGEASNAIVPTTSTGQPGDRIPGAPNWTASASADYTFRINDRLNGLLRADYSYTGTETSAFRRTDPYYTTAGNYSLVNLRVGVETKKWGAYLFCQNVGNVAGVTSSTNGLGYTALTYSTAPRTIGANVRFNL